MHGLGFWAALAVIVAPFSAAAASLHYDLATGLHPDRGSLEVRLAITIPAAQAREGVGFLLGRSYTVTTIAAGPDAETTLTDVNTPFPAQRLAVRARGAGRHDITVHLAYAGVLGPTGQPPVDAVSPRRVELSADALWYPLPERFNTRFTLDASVRGLAAGVVVASPDQVRRASDGFTLHRAKPEPDIAFVAGPGLHSLSHGRLRFVAADLDTPQARIYQTYGVKALDYLEHWLGPLPEGRAVIAIVGRPNGTGYSRPGYLVVADINGVALEGPWAKGGYIAHELSHGWWSNADFTGEDYWLVESTAEYVALRFVEHEFGTSATQDLLEKKRARAARGGPLIGKGRASDDAVYARGPILLFELEKSIGRPKLDAILAGLARRESITTKDFLDALATAAGSTVADEFETKLREP
jgi:hypothetical protein